jgi:Tol biopolymer transport system component
MRRVLAVVLAGVALGGLSASAGGTTRRVAGYRILLASDRDGVRRGYSIRPDGTRLTPLLARRSSLVPAAVSRDGSTIAYQPRDNQHQTGIYVSRADGTGLRRVVPGQAGSPALSPDGRLLAFTKKVPGIWIVRTNGRGMRRLTRRSDDSPVWSPDGQAIAFVRSAGDYAGVLVVRPLHGTAHALAWAEFEGLAWSPDGRWIAYADDAGTRTSLWLVRPNGKGKHRIAEDSGPFSWSPDGKSLAFTNDDDVVVTDVAGRARRLGLHDLYVSSVLWLPDGRLALTAHYPTQIWTVGRNGRGLRRLTRSGSNGLVGWTRLAPALPPARPVAKTERIVGRRNLVLRARVRSIAADGSRIAFITGPTPTDCDHVAVWIPAARAVNRAVPAPCGQPHEYVDRLGPVALAGTRVAWGSEGCCGNYDYTNVVTATLAHPDAPWAYVAEAAVSRGEAGGTVADGPVGHGNLIAFAIQRSCDYNAEPGEEDACPPGQEGTGALDTTVWRIGGGGRCPTSSGPVSGCTAVAKVDGEARVLAVDAGRIVVATTTDLKLLTVAGRTVRTFAETAKAAALSGSRLAVETDEGIDVYDTRSGRRLRQFPSLSDLQDLQGDILVAAPAEGIVVRKLGNGPTITIDAGADARAQLEPPGLFVAGAHRIAFTPMREVLRRLAR